MDWKNILTRGLWTLVQAPIAVELIDELSESVESAWPYTVGAGVVAFVLSAVKTALLEWRAKRQA